MTDIVVVHDTGVVDDDVQGRMGREQLGDYDVDGARIGDVQYDGVHAGLGRDDLVQCFCAATRDDDVVTALMKFLGQRSSDASAPASDQNSVSGELHLVASLRVNVAYCWRTYSSKVVGGRPSSQVNTLGLPMKSWLL